MRGLFVTGTDTGVGKTFITCALARRAREAGLRVFAFKPIETGCKWIGADQAALARASGDVPRGTYRLRMPAAPSVAAKAEGVEIDLDRVAHDFVESVQADVVLVEGAGGWRVPLTPEYDTSELARRCGLPVLIVARSTLGTINHTLLTIEAVQRDGLKIGGVVLSRRPEDDLEFASTHATQISEHSRIPILVWPSLPAL